MKRTVDTPAGRVSYELVRTSHARPQAVALPGGIVRLYAPAALSLRDADTLIRSQASALLARLSRLDGPQQQEGILPVEGVPHRIVYEDSAVPSAIENGTIYLHGADLPSLLQPLAAQRIAQRLHHWHTHIGGDYASVTVEEMGIKWGACTQQRELHFNYRLILAPPEALDYVIIHELCHLHEFSHSPRFWRMVRSHQPDCDAWKKWLSVHKRELTLP